MGMNGPTGLSERYAEVWRLAGPDTDVGNFLRRHPLALPIDRLNVLLADQRFHWNCQSPRPAERYFEQFPDLFADPDYQLAIVYGEFGARREQGEAIELEEFARRFPALYAAHVVIDDEPACVTAGFEKPATPTPRAAVPANEAATAPFDLDAPLDYDDFEFEELIGRGGFSTVFRARQKSADRQVAVKLMRGFGDSPLSAFHRFVLEASSNEVHRHPNIVGVHGLGRSPDAGYFLVMDLVDGPDTERLLETSCFAVDEVVEIMVPVARAIEHAHRHGVIHRDLKPSNVLIDSRGTVLVTDFGLAALFAESEVRVCEGERHAGTPNYMAPEQADERWGKIGPATDIYGLGGLMYSLLTARAPYEGRSVRDILNKVCSRFARPVPPRRYRPEIPKRIEEICLKCLAKIPQARFESAAEVAEAIENWRPAS